MATTRDFLVGVVIGSALGAAAALLYAPATGTETRQLLKDRTTDALDQANEMAQQARTRVNEVAQQTQTRANELVQQTQSRMSEVRDQVRSRTGEVTGQVRSKATEIGQQAQDTLDRGRQAVTVQKEAVLSAVEAGKQAYQEKQAELQQQVAEDTAPATEITPTSEDQT